MIVTEYSKICLKRPLKKKTKIGFQDQLLLNAGQKYCRMLQGEHSAILWTFTKLPFVIKYNILSFFWVAVLDRFYCTCICFCHFDKDFKPIQDKKKLQFSSQKINKEGL